VGLNEGVTRRQLEEDRSLALRNFLQSRSDAPFGLGHVRTATLQPVLDPLLGDPGLSLGRKAVDVCQGRPLHLGADRTLAVIGVGAPVRRTTIGSLVGSFVARDADVTRDPAVFDVEALPAERTTVDSVPEHRALMSPEV
jgi:hypothetical protein